MPTKNTNVSPDELLDSLRWRYAVKKFDPNRQIPTEQWRALEEALVLSPSSFGLQPWKFIVVDNPSVRKELRAASWNQPQVVDASRLVVFAIKKDLNVADVDRFIRLTAEVQGTTEESLKGYRDMMAGFVSRSDKGFDINAWSARQLYIALGVFLTSAALLGVDACPMEGIDPEAYDKMLGLDKQGYHALAVATAGYRAADDRYAAAPKVRFKPEEVIAHVNGKEKGK